MVFWGVGGFGIEENVGTRSRLEPDGLHELAVHNPLSGDLLALHGWKSVTTSVGVESAGDPNAMLAKMLDTGA